MTQDFSCSSRSGGWISAQQSQVIQRARSRSLSRAAPRADVLIPRGSDSLIRYVRENSLVPVIETGAGVCHVYVVKEADLELYLKSGEWRKPKPGLIVSVFEGYRNGYDVFAPLLERHGLTGWFFVITFCY